MDDQKAQAAFHRAMAESPDDDTARLVYADWLDDRGHADAAARLRWHVAARRHIGPVKLVASSLPDWVVNLDDIRKVQESINGHVATGDMSRDMADNLQGFLGVHERKQYGLASPKEHGGAQKAAILHSNEAWRARTVDTDGADAVPVAVEHLLRGNASSHTNGWLVRSGIPGSARLGHIRQYAAEVAAPPAGEASHVKLAAIAPPTAAQPSVLVKVPVPEAVEPAKPEANTQAPSQPTKQSPTRGPVFFLPQ